MSHLNDAIAAYHTCFNYVDVYLGSIEKAIKANDKYKLNNTNSYNQIYKDIIMKEFFELDKGMALVGGSLLPYNKTNTKPRPYKPLLNTKINKHKLNIKTNKPKLNIKTNKTHNHKYNKKGKKLSNKYNVVKGFGFIKSKKRSM
jgi:hypothetical protein